MTAGVIDFIDFLHIPRIKHQLDATISRKIYCLVVQILLNMFRALQCPSSGARQTAISASGFRMIFFLHLKLF